MAIFGAAMLLVGVYLIFAGFFICNHRQIFNGLACHEADDRYQHRAEHLYDAHPRLRALADHVYHGDYLRNKVQRAALDRLCGRRPGAGRGARNNHDACVSAFQADVQAL